MPPSKIDFDTVRQFARELGDIQESQPHGVPAVRAKGTVLAWIPPHKSVEPGSLAVRIPIEQRTELIAAAPETYYLTNHYLNYPTVLVRLSEIHPDALKDLLRMSWASIEPKSSSKKRQPAKRPSKRSV